MLTFNRGSSSNEAASSIAVDSQGNAYITGRAESSSFPTTPGAFQTTVTGGSAFVTKLNAAGTSLVYSTFVCSANFSGLTTGLSIALDPAGNAVVTGATTATDFPLVNPLKTKGSFFKTTDGASNWSNNNTGLNVDVTTIAIAPSAPNTIYAGTFSSLYQRTDSGATWTKPTNTGFPAFSNPLGLAG